MSTVGQNRIYAPYMTVYTVISLPKIPYIHRIYIYIYIHGSGQPYFCPSKQRTYQCNSCIWIQHSDYKGARRLMVFVQANSAIVRMVWVRVCVCVRKQCNTWCNYWQGGPYQHQWCQLCVCIRKLCNSWCNYWRGGPYQHRWCKLCVCVCTLNCVSRRP
jgi:hypothetical protein